MYGYPDVKITKFRPLDDGSWEISFHVEGQPQEFTEVVSREQIFEEFGFENEDQLLRFMAELGGQYLN